MKYYTKTIPIDLEDKLEEKGMPELLETYAEVFDWLMGKGMMIRIDPLCESVNSGWVFDYTITWDGGSQEIYNEGPSVPWFDAANAAIRKALELIAD